MADFVANLVRWPSHALAWLTRAWLVIFTVSVIAVALALSLYFFQTEQGTRLAGLALQLLGITAAAVGIRDTRRMFGKPSFLQLIRTWFKSIPRLKARVVSASASGSLSISASARAHLWRGPGPDPTLESRLAAAEANLDELYKRTNAAESAFDAHVRTAAQSLREEKGLRQEADRQLHLKIEAASTDGLHLAAVGVVWLACGVVLSTAPNELLGLVR